MIARESQENQLLTRKPLKEKFRSIERERERERERVT